MVHRSLPGVHWLMWPLMQWSTDPDHNPVHVPMHEQMHVHARCSRGYSLDGRFTESPCPHGRPRERGRSPSALEFPEQPTTSRQQADNKQQRRGPARLGGPPAPCGEVGRGAGQRGA
ncbi:hypothetical protein DVZ84_11075 [Streptomyces parvulus]|uniref:Uncharacterized protein n=1 Tax=Streptomyces parvulus TaxID=146923 RepID=A0A369V8Y0_9ACTN|nr:hypothetical protein DVZ84_11075 [Streptomyces parvulus]